MNSYAPFNKPVLHRPVELAEFINHHLLRWCTTRQITFSRGRAAHSNDQAHVEQKNWSVVRRTIGYHRYDTPRELDLLNQLWPLISLQVNLFLPQQKLISKTRQGAKVTKRYDRATTPLNRLTRDYSDMIDPHDQTRLETLHHDTDLVDLKHRISDIQGNLLELARRRGHVQRRAKTNHVYLSRTKLNRSKRAPSNESTTPTTRASSGEATTPTTRASSGEATTPTTRASSSEATTPTTRAS